MSIQYDHPFQYRIFGIALWIAAASVEEEQKGEESEGLRRVLRSEGWNALAAFDQYEPEQINQLVRDAMWLTDVVFGEMEDLGMIRKKDVSSA